MNRRDLMKAAMTAAVVSSGTGLSTLARAQGFPNKPITIIVPTGAGGGYDQIARIVAEVWPSAIGQSVVVDNRTGAGSRVGTQAVAQSAPDGYTLLLGGLSNMVFNAGLYPNLSYDPVKDFTTVGVVAKYAYLMVARADLPADNIKELIAAVKAAPEKFTIGTAGNGTGQHVQAVAFAKSLGVNMTIVPYKSAGAVYQDLLGGRVDLFIDTPSTAKPHIDSKRAKPLVITGTVRDPRWPDVPTVAEAGLPLMEMNSWFGIYAPSKTPPAVLEKLRTTLKMSFEDPGLKRRMDTMGVETVSMTMPQTDAFMKSEYLKWTTFIKAQGLSGD